MPSLSDGSLTLADVDVLDLSISSGHLFAGTGGSRTLTSVTDGTVGLAANGITARLITATPLGGPSYSVFDLDVATASLSGLGAAFSFDIADAFVQYNAVSVPGAKLNWSSAALGAYQVAGIEGTLNLKVGASIGLTLGGFVFVAGTFTLTDSATTDERVGLVREVAAAHGRAPELDELLQQVVLDPDPERTAGSSAR